MTISQYRTDSGISLRNSVQNTPTPTSGQTELFLKCFSTHCVILTVNINFRLENSNWINHGIDKLMLDKTVYSHCSHRNHRWLEELFHCGTEWEVWQSVPARDERRSTFFHLGHEWSRHILICFYSVSSCVPSRRRVPASRSKTLKQIFELWITFTKGVPIE